jgi:hypothetical protein
MILFREIVLYKSAANLFAGSGTQVRTTKNKTREEY